MSAIDYRRRVSFEQTYAACLLLQVSKLAAKELSSVRANGGESKAPTPLTPTTTPETKLRCVSFCEEEDLTAPREVSPELTPVSPVASPSPLSMPPRKHCNNHVTLPRQTQPASKFVGHTSASGMIKAELRRKFAWKDYPELERFLMDRRVEYFRHSQQYNYTTTQKDYNNSLTKELIELANSVGYVFDGFTFAMIRDRIRCYYKSYVQAIRKGRRFHGIAGD